MSQDPGQKTKVIAEKKVISEKKVITEKIQIPQIYILGYFINFINWSCFIFFQCFADFTFVVFRGGQEMWEESTLCRTWLSESLLRITSHTYTDIFICCGKYVACVIERIIFPPMPFILMNSFGEIPKSILYTSSPNILAGTESIISCPSSVVKPIS